MTEWTERRQMRGAFGEDSRKTADLGQEGWGLRRVRRENIDRGTE